MFQTGSSIISGFSIKHHTHIQLHFVKPSGFSIMSLYIILKDNSKKIRLLGRNKLAHTNTHARTSHSLCCVQPTGHKHNLMICGRHCLCLFVCVPLVLVAMSATFWKASRKAPVIAMVVLRQDKHKDTFQRHVTTAERSHVSYCPGRQHGTPPVSKHAGHKRCEPNVSRPAPSWNQATEYLLSN